jgi:hypothetical protein
VFSKLDPQNGFEDSHLLRGEGGYCHVNRTFARQMAPVAHRFTLRLLLAPCQHGLISKYAQGAKSRAIMPLCIPRTSSGVLKVRPGNIGDEGYQEQGEI